MRRLTWRGSRQGLGFRLSEKFPQFRSGGIGLSYTRTDSSACDWPLEISQERHAAFGLD